MRPRFQMRPACLLVATVLLLPAVLAIPIPAAAAASSTLGWSCGGGCTLAPLRHAVAAALTNAASRNITEDTTHNEPAPPRPRAHATRITSEWVSAPAPPMSVMEHALVAIACDSSIPLSSSMPPSLILIGGSDTSGAATSSLLSLDVARGQWLVLQPMPQPRQAAMAVLSHTWGGVVVCGGRCGRFSHHAASNRAHAPACASFPHACIIPSCLHQLRLLLAASVLLPTAASAELDLGRARTA